MGRGREKREREMVWYVNKIVLKIIKNSMVSGIDAVMYPFFCPIFFQLNTLVKIS